MFDRKQSQPFSAPGYNPASKFAKLFGEHNPFANLSFHEQLDERRSSQQDERRSSQQGPREPANTGEEEKDPPIEYPLELTLEDLFTGRKKKMKITRNVVNSANWTTSKEEKLLTLDIKPGWKAGTKITFPNEGDQAIGKQAADVIFIVKEKPHPIFKREGDNLLYTAEISLKDALCSGVLQIPTIDGRNISVAVTEVIKPGSVKAIPGEGMPISKSPGERGNLVVTFDVEFPSQLSPECQELIASALV